MVPIDPPYTQPKIHKGDTASTWYVYFRYYDQAQQKWRLFIRKMGINFITNRKEKEAEISKLRMYIKQKLESGWNPISNEQEHRHTRELLPCLLAELENRLPSMRPRSRDSFRSVFGLFAAWLEKQHWQYLDVGAFDTPMAREYLDYIGRQRKYSGKTLNTAKGMLSVVFNGLVKREVIPKNPFAAVPKYKEQSGTRNQAFADSEREQLRTWLAENEPWLYNFTQIMFYCFIRREELYRLQVAHVNLSDNSISIPANVSKNGKSESVVIPRNLRPILESMQLHLYPAQYYIFGHTGREAVLRPAEQPVTNRNHAYNQHRSTLARLHIHGRTLYSWKHSGVCAAYRATNGDIYAIMRQLRHYDLKMTQIYLKSLGLVENTAMAGAW